jgi:CRP-like cAMP-binding protein
MLASSQNLTRAFWRETLVDSAIFRAWVINLGRRDAMARIGHLLCELAERHRAAGLEKEGVMPLPWTQVDVADACGISAVHANRAIQELRRLGLVQWDSKRVRICNPGELSRRAEFSPDYLHLEPLEVYAA